MIRFFLLLFLYTSLFSSMVERYRWENGESYLMFLQRHDLPTKELYYNLDKDDQKLTEEMRSGIHYQILRDKNKNIEQLLLPLNDELQIHIYKKKGHYKFEVIPIISTTKAEALYTTITSSPMYTIYKETGSRKLAQIFINGFKHSLNFKNDIRQGDKLVMIYTQKYRLEQPFSMPTLKVAMIEIRHKKHYIYRNSDGNYYNEKGHQIEGFLLYRPIPRARISSRFSKRRFDPVLHKWRAHLGVDFAARRGTPIHAAGDGRIVRANRSVSYGNVIYIRHAGGYTTRYAHMKHFRRGIHYGKHVKKGQVIGYVGTTGWSTGPHLHFEVRYHGRAINPLHIVRVTTKKLHGKARRAFLKLKKNYDQSVALHLTNKTQFHKPPPFEPISYIHLLDEKHNDTH